MNAISKFLRKMEVPASHQIRISRTLLSMKRIAFVLVPFVLFAACKKESVSIVGSGKDMGSQTLVQVLPGKGPIETPDHGKELWFAITPLTGLKGKPANGVTQAHYLEDGTFLVTVQLNIERAPDGFFYEAWLANDAGVEVTLGHLRTPFGDVRHQLKFLGKQDLRTYSKFFVTLEKDDGNPAASEAVAEGKLVERKR